jgi:ComF family protein
MSQWLSLLRNAVLDALAFIVPVECAGCAVPDRAVCSLCIAALEPTVVPRVLANGTRVFTALRYEARVRGVILAFKEQNRTDAARALARPLAAAIALAREHAPAGALVVTVPTSRDAYRRRGYDPVRVLCARAGVRSTKALAIARAGSKQKSLTIDERATNRRGSMRVVGDVRGRAVVVVDDVVTTGATLVEAIRALSAAGAEVYSAASLAFTPRLFGSLATPSEFGGDIAN